MAVISRKSYPFSSLSAALVLLGSLAAFSLVGCGAVTNNEGSAATTEASETSSGLSYNLSKTVSFQGLSVKIDPSWSINDKNEYAYYFAIDDHNDHFGIQTVLHGQTGDLNTAFAEFFSSDGEMPEKLDSWSEAGVKYVTGEYNIKSNSSITWVLAASEESTGKGFMISFTAAKDRFNESEQKKIFDDVIKTVEYDSSKTTMDSKDWWGQNQSSSSSTSSSSSGNPSATSGFKATLATLGTFDTNTVNGSGDDVVDLPKPGTPCLMTISHNGSSNFAVHTVDSSGNDVDLLINTIGSYNGIVTDYTDYESASMLSIKADGAWAVTFSPLSEMAEIGNGTEHSGDGVFYIETNSLTKLHLTNTGDSNFVVKGIGMSDSKLLVNEIGAYDGTVIWGQPKSFLIVQSDGTWTASW